MRMCPSRLRCSAVVVFSLVACDPKGEGGGAEGGEQIPAAEVTPGSTDCVGPVKAGDAAETIKVNGSTWELSGSTLRLVAPTKAAALVLGVLSDIKEDSSENLANLRQFVTWFKKKQVEAVVVAGDTGETRKQIEAALEVLAQLKVPIFNVMGNRESAKGYRAAMKSLRAKHGHVFDLNVVRRVDMPAADLVSMPGYFNAGYVHADDGCVYSGKDVASLDDLAKASDGPVILVSHGGPKQKGEQAIDRTAEGDNVGDPALTAAIKRNKIAMGVFGNIHEAGGHATDLEGAERLEPGKFHKTLFLNPGPADAVRWGMNDGSESVGMAAVLTVKGGQGSYEVMRLGGDPAPQKKAKKRRRRRRK